MQAKAFDDAIRAQYEAGSLPAVQPDWEGLSMQLDKPARKRIIWWYYPTAAAVITAIVMLTRSLFSPAAAPQLASKKSPAPPCAAQPVATIQGTSIIGGVPAAAIANAGATRAVAAPTTTQHAWIPVKKTVPDIKIPSPQVVQSGIQDAGLPPVHVQDHTVLPAATNPEHRNNTAYVPWEKEPQPRQGMAFSLLGGIQSGSLHTGYTVGFLVHQPVGRHFSVGGSVAVVSAVAQQSLTLTPANYQLFTAATGTGSGNAAAVSTNLYYLQLAPTLRYSITRRLLLASGPDYQRLLQDAGNKTLIYDENKAQLAPINDFGWNSGLDYTLTHHLQCGFRYRAGINNWLQPATGQLNRNYMQAHLSVQLGR